MNISERLIPEFDLERTDTRNLVQRAPEYMSDYKPHARSMILGRLAGHIAELPSWAARITDTNYRKDQK